MSNLLSIDRYISTKEHNLSVVENVAVSFDNDGSPLSFINDDVWVFQHYVLDELRTVKKSVEKLSVQLKEAIFVTFLARDAEYKQTKVSSILNKVQQALLIEKELPFKNTEDMFSESGFWALMKKINGRYSYATVESFVCSYIQLINAKNNLGGEHHVRLNKSKVAKKYCKKGTDEAKQTLSMPLSVASQIMGNAIDLLNSANNSIDSICKTIEGTKQNRALIGTDRYCSPSKISKKHLEGTEWGSLLDGNYRSQYVRMWLNRTIWAAHHLLMAFTGLRIHEVHRVHDSSFQTYNDNGIIYHTITAETSKLSNGPDQVDTWICSSLCKDILELISKLKSAAGVKSKSIMLSFPYLYQGNIKKHMSCHPRLIENLTADTILDEQSYLEYCQLNRGRELDLKIGDSWPLANHQWRRTFATMSLRFDLATLPAIKRQFKHISLQMTEWYTNYARITRNEDTRADAELNKLIHDVQNEMSTDVLFEAYNGNEKFAGGMGKEILNLRNDGGVPEIYRERSAIKAMLEQGKISLKFAGLNYCTNGYRCDQDGVVNAAFCVDCKSSIIDAKIAKKWKHLHERCVGHLEFSFDCGEVSPVSYAHFTSQIRAAEHVMDQFGIQYEKFQELS
jgi:integrase